MKASEIIIAPSGTQIDTFLGNTDPPNIDMAVIGAKFAGCGNIRIKTPAAIKQTAMIAGKYFSFMVLL
jgi:hypothetical protein